MNDDLVGHNAPGDTSRRVFISGAIAAGFALAVRPVAATTIDTDDGGLAAGSVQIPVEGGAMLPAYRAAPERTKGPLPTVIVVQEIFGVHEHIQAVCRRLAKSGYLAIAPELYFRQGDPRNYPEVDQLMKLVMSVPDAQVLSDLDATVAWAARNGGDARHTAITGFCWGGRIVWLYAARNPSLKAAVAWYGRLGGTASANTPKQPLDVAAEVRVPVLGLYGGQDKGISAESIAQMRTALKAAKAQTEIIVYPDAGHGFNADYRPSYNEAAARDGWQKMLSWFKQHGV
ncbi:dienelactone hydrolase family protein [Jeongeupia naejangsanensis]|uniref:Dienelactone hydrolase family protein n=1 Tax=Jeongeupia naejangsanensis TaxID=613195 RepID=A0ABS2BGK5_9NEIS|nr:dienelactone hydrolase family protein [Jeongeupia naejangsanensis]MBM3114738.1 dienelactone hydrolase family protein [Jeongeupia naejangsanensis]